MCVLPVPLCTGAFRWWSVEARRCGVKKGEEREAGFEGGHRLEGRQPVPQPRVAGPQGLVPHLFLRPRSTTGRGGRRRRAHQVGKRKGVDSPLHLQIVQKQGD
ncbi:hypothetical protein CEXT_541771 [Caerostris extrusa]|uniref:Uncharacterized protein n=1 Tax=Caerostris extrusa TaxID=172846 RepID=A0AAV4WR00_CAEEX|nr:hypothetical protein CEXT_541771 [Caerostris extrusa]